MTLKELKSEFTKNLIPQYPKEEVHSFFSILSEFFLNYSRLDTVTRADELISEEIQQKYQQALIRLQQNEPIQYIVGGTEFYGLPFAVNKNTLIPRPETEELVAWIVAEIDSMKTQPSLSLLDIGTGSGCIAIALAKNVNVQSVLAIDVSDEALVVARQNAETNNVNVTFLQMDILAAERLPKSYDVIVSNPPYVRHQEKEMMNDNVLQHEPDRALFVSNEDPLVFYRQIALLAKQDLKPGGKLFFEINEYLSRELKIVLHTIGFTEIELRKDMFGKDRMFCCSKG